MTHVEEKLPSMTMGRLVEIFEKSQNGKATLEDITEIVSKMFLSQSLYQRGAQKREDTILYEISRLKERLSLLEQFAGSPLYSTVMYDNEEMLCDKCGEALNQQNEEG